jgi:hypothetical protein
MQMRAVSFIEIASLSVAAFSTDSIPNVFKTAAWTAVACEVVKAAGYAIAGFIAVIVVQHVLSAVCWTQRKP